MVRFKFETKHKIWSGSTVDGYCYIHLRNIRSHQELVDTIIHESMHQILLSIGRTLDIEDHRIMKALEVEWF